MLAQLAARLRQRQAGGAGEGGEDDDGVEGAAIVLDDNCAVGNQLHLVGILCCVLIDLGQIM